MQYFNIRYLLVEISALCLLLFMFSGCEGSRVANPGGPSGKLSSHAKQAPHGKQGPLPYMRKAYFSDSFETESDQDLSNRTSDSGHTYSGADVSDFEVEASSNSLHAPGEPDGNSSWWATPDVQTPNSKYRSVIKDATLGGAAKWFHLYVGVRHDGEPRGSETVYSLELAGGNVGIVLHRINAGTDTVLVLDANFTNENDIRATTPVDMELQAKTVGKAVILNAWVTVGEGERQHVFRNVKDTSKDRITETGRAAFGFSPIAPRIGKAEVRKTMPVDRGSGNDVIDDGNDEDDVEFGGAEPPLLDQFEEDMVYYGVEVGDWQQTTSTQESQYYDGLFVHLQVRDYAQANLSSPQATAYLNNASTYIARSIQVVRDGYVIPNGGVVDDWRRFPKGLYYHYQQTGDQASYDAVLMLRDGRTVGTGDPISHPEFANAFWIREMSYWLQAHVWGEKLDGTRDVAKVQTYIQYLENILYQCRYATPLGRHGNEEYGMQAFYMGLEGQALIEWYELAGNTYWPTDHWATIPNALKDVYGWMMDQGPNGAKVVDAGYPDPNIGEPFWVENYNGSGYGLFHSWDRSFDGRSTGAYSDVSNLIAPVYYWIGQHFNSQEFIELGDKVFAGAVYHQSFVGAKQYDQQYVVIFDGLEWRQQYVDAN